MATQSFEEELLIDTDEKAELLLRLIEEAESKPRAPPMVPSINELLAEGERLIKEGFLDRV